MLFQVGKTAYFCIVINNKNETMTTNSTSTFNKVIGAIVIAFTTAFLASCASDVDYNNVFVETSISNSTTLSIGDYTVTVNQLNSTFNYTVAGNAQDQEDIRIESQMVKSDIENESRSALSTININVKGEQLNGASTTYTIKNITICGAYADGQFNFNTNLMTVAENAQTTDFTLPVSNKWNSREISTNDEFVNASEFSFFMIPQSVENVQIIIDYEVENNGYVIFRGSQVENLSGRWIQNKTYNYNINLTNGAERVSFNPSIQ